MIKSVGVPGAHTTMTDLSSWQQVSPHLEQIKTEVSPDQMTDATTAEAVEEIVDMTVGNRAVMDTEGKSGGDRIETHKKTL